MAMFLFVLRYSWYNGTEENSRQALARRLTPHLKRKTDKVGIFAEDSVCGSGEFVDINDPDGDVAVKLEHLRTLISPVDRAGLSGSPSRP